MDWGLDDIAWDPRSDGVSIVRPGLISSACLTEQHRDQIYHGLSHRAL
jgi:hypothetical protein